MCEGDQGINKNSIKRSANKHVTRDVCRDDLQSCTPSLPGLSLLSEFYVGIRQ